MTFWSTMFTFFLTACGLFGYDWYYYSTPILPEVIQGLEPDADIIWNMYVYEHIDLSDYDLFVDSMKNCGLELPADVNQTIELYWTMKSDLDIFCEANQLPLKFNIVQDLQNSIEVT